jgi:hypothetical protein
MVGSDAKVVVVKTALEIELALGAPLGVPSGDPQGAAGESAAAVEVLAAR